MRIGCGYDTHRLVEGRSLVLGGVSIPWTRGPDAHSDGDVVCHALADALLGALARGDIGVHFPASDPTFEGISSLELLSRVRAMVQEAGYEVHNVDVMVLLERPRLAPHVPRMRELVAEALGVVPEAVSIKATTNEGMGEVGRGDAVAAWAVASVRPWRS